MRLYELADGIRQLIATTEERDGLLTDEDLAKLDTLSESFEGKAETICRLISEEEAEVVARTAEVDRLQAGITTAKNRQKRLKQYLFDCMAKSGQRRIELTTFKVWIQANGTPSCDCKVEPDKLPEQFRKVTIEPNTSAAVEVWKTTGTAPDGFTIHRGEHLRIK